MQTGSNFLTAFGLFGTCGLMLLALFAAWPAMEAYQKGRDFRRWHFFSLFLFTVALIASFLISYQALAKSRSDYEELL
jgi:ABC-type Mn2+/Zn2+ transport system permease subunit